MAKKKSSTFPLILKMNEGDTLTKGSIVTVPVKAEEDSEEVKEVNVEVTSVTAVTYTEGEGALAKINVKQTNKKVPVGA